MFWRFSSPNTATAIKSTSAVELLAASSVALIWSLPASKTLSQELRALAEPSAGVKVRATVQVDETSSFHEATDWSPIFSSLPEMVTAGPAITFTVFVETVMTGALVSLAGVGSTGSSPPQETAKDIASKAMDKVFVALRMRLNQRIVKLVPLDIPS